MSIPPDQLLYMEAHPEDNRGPGIIVINAVCIVPALIAIVLRIWARTMVEAGIG